ncbi:hypothetical protein HAX54_031719 [Datura stramonium]|uniref:PGG domain-containing protein n=1 Tax=Datura stramonium TaxID=4076 RepID=A0ABS8VC33_DATST|nr:hypothetical protein [Datura stramonium]
MDPSMYNAAMKGNMEDGDFSLADHLKKEEENGYQVTPNGNTILHVATLSGQREFVAEVLKITPALLCYKNKKNETALHIAANVGQSEVVNELLSIEGREDGNNNETLVRMTDDIGDTALHKAVRSGHLDIVRMLLKLLVDPQLDFPANKAGETPLYLAAESGFHDALIEILKLCQEPTTYVAAPSNRTPLHAAIIQEHTECARSLWQWNKPLCEEPDQWGWNSLHYAVKQGLIQIVSDMLGWKKSLAYVPAGHGENDWTTAFHIAASEGDVGMIIVLLDHCPDCWDMQNSRGQNALHVAILNNHEGLVMALLFEYYGICDSLVDEPDNDGNTPLHLLAAYGNHVPPLISSHPRAKKMSFNKQNQTPLDIALSRTWTVKKEKLVGDLCSINGRLGQRDFKVKRITETSGKIKRIREEDDQDKAKRDAIEIEKIMKAAEIQLVVATLLMTVTFAAGFTLPGGLDSELGPNKGMAVLLRKTAFRAFVVSDVIAFACSAGAIFVYFFMADSDVDIEEDDDKENQMAGFAFLRRLYYIAGTLQLLAMAAVVVAFVTGLYATLAHSIGLAVSVCVIGCVSFFMYFWIIMCL